MNFKKTTIKIGFLFFMSFTIISCGKLGVLKSQDSHENAADYAKPVYFFEKFSCKNTANKIRKPINWNSLPEAKKHSTEIEKIFKSTEPNFANHYLIAAINKNPETTFGYMIDVRNGTIYKLPKLCLPPENEIDFRKDSRLFVGNECSGNYSFDNLPFKGFEWNEATKKFIALKWEDFQYN